MIYMMIKNMRSGENPCKRHRTLWPPARSQLSEPPEFKIYRMAPVETPERPLGQLASRPEPTHRIFGTGCRTRKGSCCFRSRWRNSAISSRAGSSGCRQVVFLTGKRGRRGDESGAPGHRVQEEELLPRVVERHLWAAVKGWGAAPMGAAAPGAAASPRHRRATCGGEVP